MTTTELLLLAIIVVNGSGFGGVIPYAVAYLKRVDWCVKAIQRLADAQGIELPPVPKGVRLRDG